MSVIDFLLDLFRDESEREAFEDDPSGYLAEHAPEGLTAEDILAAMPGVCAALPEGPATTLRTAYRLSGTGGGAGGTGSGGGSTAAVAPQAGSVPPPPAVDPGGDPVEQVVQQLRYYTNVLNVTNQRFEDNDTTFIDDRDTTVDNSVNQNITAFGDVNQTFDNDVVSGDGAVAAGDGAQVNTGDGAVQVGGDVSDATIATGDVGGSVTGDVTDSVVGDGNQVIQDSDVGAVSFGDGDATNVEAENAVLGDGTIVDGGEGDIAFNQGDGDLTQIEDSVLSESVVGDGTVQSNDVAISAEDGSAVAFGDGADAGSGDISIEGNSGTVQIADDGATQTGVTDNSIADSFNTEVQYTDNSINDSFDTTDSGNLHVDASDNSVDNSFTDVSDDDGVDIDVDGPLA